MVVSSVGTCFASEDISEVDRYSNIYYDEQDNKIETIIHKSDNEYEVTIYVNDVEDHECITNVDTGEMVLTVFEKSDNLARGKSDDLSGGIKAISETYNISDFITDADGVEDVDDIEFSPMSAFNPTTSYNINYSFNTDYVYQGKILKATTNSCAYENSSRDRYYGKKIQFSSGTLAGLIVGVLLTAFDLYTSGGSITASTLAALGLPVVAGVLIDSITTTVYLTKFRVGTKVYFNGTYTANVNQYYDRMLVNIDAVTMKTHYADDMYGYNIVKSAATYASSNSAKAFSDKFITGHKPNLYLPITSLPYNS